MKRDLGFVTGFFLAKSWAGSEIAIFHGIRIPTTGHRGIHNDDDSELPRYVASVVVALMAVIDLTTELVTEM